MLKSNAADPSFSDPFPLLFARSCSRRDPRGALEGVALKRFVTEYEGLREAAPKRPPAKLYFVGHTGFASSSGATNQREQQIAIALVNAVERQP